MCLFGVKDGTEVPALWTSGLSIQPVSLLARRPG